MNQKQSSLFTLYFNWQTLKTERPILHENIERHTAHTIVSWPNPKQWVIVHTSDLMMIIRQSIYILSIITKETGKLKRHRNREFVFISIVQFMSANSRIRFGLQIVLFVCLYITPSHYHHCANFIWRHWTHKMPVRYNLSSVWVRLSIFSQLSIIQYVGLCVFTQSFKSIHTSPGGQWVKVWGKSLVTYPWGCQTQEWRHASLGTAMFPQPRGRKRDAYPVWCRWRNEPCHSPHLSRWWADDRRGRWHRERGWVVEW